MKEQMSVSALERLGRVRLSRAFIFRDMLHSEVSAVHRVPNVPSDPALAIRVGKHLCEELLEPLIDHFGPVSILSGYRSPELNALCNRLQCGCASNERNRAGHIWDLPDKNGNIGAMASVVIAAHDPEAGKPIDWQSIAKWVHQNLPYHSLRFHRRGAFNIAWRENPKRCIYSYVEPRGYLRLP